jgi:hypothetical protein
MHARYRLTTLALTASLAAPALATAQGTTGSPSTPASSEAPAATATTQDDDPDKDLNFSQPDFTLAALPTTLRLPKFGSAFRVTHRFTRPLGQGDFGELVEDFFGFDSGGQIGLEYRFGLFKGAQVGIHRTSDRTIQFFGLYDLMNEKDGRPLGLAALAAIDGTNNFRDSYSPTLGVLLSKELGQHGAVYAEPMWVNNSNELPSELVDDNDAFVLGLGTRLRVRPTVYVVAEWAPRVAGHDPGVDHVSFGVEKRAGRHGFQINFSNSFATTFGQIARGGLNNDDWYIGFNIARKFF